MAYWEKTKQAASIGWNEGAAFVRGANAFANRTAAGRAFKQGFGEVLGFEYNKAGENIGIFGIKKSAGHMKYTKLRAKGLGHFESFRGGLGVQSKMLRRGRFLGIGKKMGFLGVLGKIAGPAFMAHTVYSGYQEGGMMGAAGALVESGVTWGAFKAAGAIAGGVVVGTIATAVAVGVGGYMWGEAATNYRKNLQRTEFVPKDVVNVIQGAYTDRARTMELLNNSALNARMAIGDEARLLHSSYSAISVGGRR